MLVLIIISFNCFIPDNEDNTVTKMALRFSTCWFSVIVRNVLHIIAGQHFIKQPASHTIWRWMLIYFLSNRMLWIILAYKQCYSNRSTRVTEFFIMYRIFFLIFFKKKLKTLPFKLMTYLSSVFLSGCMSISTLKA